MNKWPQVFLFVVFTCVLMTCIAAVVSMVTDTQEEPVEQASVALVLNTEDASIMHSYGLPSKDDVVHWHVFGEWGYKDCNDNIRMFAQLPGETWRWDNLYDIKWRKAFQY